MTDHRPRADCDEELGAALRALDVPEHDRGFHRQLEQRLARSPAVGRAPGLGRRARMAIAAAFVLVVAGGVAIFGAERAPRIVTPQLASAAEIKAKIRVSLAGAENVSGVLVFDGPHRDDVKQWRFALTRGGDLRLAGPTAGEVITYDADSGLVRSAQRSASLGGGPLFYAEHRGVAPGLPDAGAPSLPPLDELGAYVRALLAAADPRVDEAGFGGRPAWRLAMDVRPNAIAPEISGDRLEITVDRATGVPVRVVERRRGSFLRETRIEGLAVDAELAPDTFRLEFPPGAEVMRSDDGFRRVDLGAAARIVGYRPLVPEWVPDGYELAEVTVAEAAGPTGREAGNPPSRMVVSLSYRRGLDQFLVTTRLAAVPDAASPRWSDPLATGEGFVDDPEHLVVVGGALAGTPAELVIAPRGIPHVWARTDSLVVTVGGDLSRPELVRIAGSLARA